MPGAPFNVLPAHIPDGYVVVPISADQVGVPLRVCLLLRRQPDPVWGHLVRLRDLFDGGVWLGCLIDAGGGVHQWLELWVQNVSGLAAAASVSHATVNNQTLDLRWQDHFGYFGLLDPRMLIRTGWEAVHPAPTLVDITALRPLHPADASGRPWRLCQDDALLAERGLPVYATSLHRYLYRLDGGMDAPLIPVTAGAPTNQHTQPLSELVGERPDLIDFNAGGGLMLIRPYMPVSLSSFLDLLTGSPGQPPEPGGDFFQACAQKSPTDGVPSMDGQGWLCVAHRGRGARVLEVFHLKLRALGDAVAAVAAFVRQHQRPLLGLTADSFRVCLADPGGALPALWTAQVALADPGDALELPLAGIDPPCFLPGRPAVASIYRPVVDSELLSGQGSVRIRQVIPGEGDQTILEGTLSTQDRVHANCPDLLLFKVPLKCGPVTFQGRLETQAALAVGEHRFRTFGQVLAPAALAQLKALAGVSIPNVFFSFLPLLGSPCDLYALAVLAVRTLLSENVQQLPVAIDGVFSLARQVAAEHDDAVGLTERIRAICDRQPRYFDVLGPQHLVHDQMTAEEAMDLVPRGLWLDTLAMIVRLFPGLGPDSVCFGLGNVPGQKPHEVFMPLLADLARLQAQTRSVILVDWRVNREVYSVISDCLVRLSLGEMAALPSAPSRKAKT